MRTRTVAVAGLLGAVAFARAKRWFPVRVEGVSMTPTLQPGDFLAVRRLRSGEPRAGQLVVVRTAEREIVKRVVTSSARVLASDELWVEGDNADASTDSRTDGPIRRDSVVGVVRARYKPLRSIRRF